MDAPPSAPVHVLHDGAAGNRRQALALAEAWALPFAESVLQPRLPWRWAAPRVLPGSHAAFGAAFAAMLDAPPPVVVGCGRQAALATRLLRQRGSAVVQILHPRLPTPHWDAVVLPAHDGVQGGNVLALDGSLNPIDDAWLERERAAHPALGEGAGPITVLLVGGPTDDSDWDRHALDGILELLLRWHQRDGGTLWVVGSRRTPSAMRRQVKHRMGDRAHVWMDDRDGPNPYAGAIAWADRLVVTPDSANLISEAAATRAPLWIAVPRYNRGRIRHLVAKAIDSGRARALGPDSAPWPVEPWRESARIAERLRPWALERIAARQPATGGDIADSAARNEDAVP
ncbi:ELM1/GtrOC1 family putative glycosyltransferase [Silanimonas algicola]